MSRYRHLTASELRAMPTISEGQADSLKIDECDETAQCRVWISRCTVDDGESYDNKVTLEYRYIDGRYDDKWHEISWQAK